MRLSLMFASIVLFCLGCGKQHTADDQAGTATQSAFTEIIDGKQGYIIEQAAFLTGNKPPVYSIGDKFKLSAGQSSVLIVTSQQNGEIPGTVLALQFPAFAAGTVQDFNGDTVNAQYWLLGKSDGKDVMISTGILSGSIRCIKKSKSALNLGLNRDILDGVGDIEIVVSNIKAGDLKFPTEKKYAARFQLPIISLSEIAKITQPS